MDAHRLPNIVEAALPPHHRATKSWRHGRFDNIWPEWQERSFGDVRRWNRERRAAGVPTDGFLEGNHTPSRSDWEAAFPLAPVDWAAINAPPAGAVQATWVGHSTVLLQMEGLTILTDPVFAQRCSPVQWMGPRRLADVPFEIEDERLPKVDAVVISHNHYDHLSSGCVKRLHKRWGSHLRWYVPLGLGKWLRGKGIAAANISEADWWQEIAHPGRTDVTFVLTPAMHWSMRNGFDRKAVLWGGWAVVGPSTRAWFAGDTGYCGVFHEIGERLGPFDLSLIPTGAYAPRWFMKPQHVDTEEAVQIHADVRSRRSVAIHCATFCLTDEPMDEPVKRLPREAAAAGLAPDAFVTLRHGATLATAGGVTLNAPLLLA